MTSLQLSTRVARIEAAIVILKMYPRDNDPIGQNMDTVFSILERCNAKLLDIRLMQEAPDDGE